MSYRSSNFSFLWFQFDELEWNTKREWLFRACILTIKLPIRRNDILCYAINILLWLLCKSGSCISHLVVVVFHILASALTFIPLLLILWLPFFCRLCRVNIHCDPILKIIIIYDETYLAVVNVSITELTNLWQEGQVLKNRVAAKICIAECFKIRKISLYKTSIAKVYIKSHFRVCFKSIRYVASKTSPKSVCTLKLKTVYVCLTLIISNQNWQSIKISRISRPSLRGIFTSLKVDCKLLINILCVCNVCHDHVGWNFAYAIILSISVFLFLQNYFDVVDNLHKRICTTASSLGRCFQCGFLVLPICINFVYFATFFNGVFFSTVRSSAPK